MTDAVLEEHFLKLVEENGGFEYVQAYRNDVDLILGGKGDTFWCVTTKKGRITEAYTAKFSDGAWKDTLVKGSGANQKTQSVPAGTTIRKIAEKAYLCQDETWVTRRTPKPVEDAHPHYHYVYGFGDKGLDVSVRYGVTIAFNDLKNADAAFHLRDLATGSGVEAP